MAFFICKNYIPYIIVRNNDLFVNQADFFEIPRIALKINKGSNPFCEMIQSRLSGKRRCLKEIGRATQIAAGIGEPYIFQCHANMIEFIAAIRNGGQKACAFLCGPMLLRHPDLIFIKDTLLKVHDLSINPFLLKKTFPEIPVLSERRVQAAADLLFTVANYCNKMDSTFQRQKHDMDRASHRGGSPRRRRRRS
jgi:two-component system response regulator YesN